MNIGDIGDPELLQSAFRLLKPFAISFDGVDMSS